LLIALFATASHGQFPTDPDPDSLNIEFVGQINLTGEPVADRLLTEAIYTSPAT
jgi:hypothetical protein